MSSGGKTFEEDSGSGTVTYRSATGAAFKLGYSQEDVETEVII